MSALNFLMKYVRTGTAEGDRSFLAQAFVMPAQFNELCAIEPSGMRILIGNKGIGKSAVVEWIYKITQNRKLASILVRPDNISSQQQSLATDIGSLKRYYYEVLIRTVSSQIGSQLKGLLTGDAARLYNEAKQNGIAEDDFIQKTLQLISTISTPAAKINGIQLAKDLSGTNSPNSLIASINSQLASSGSVFYLLFDDTDQLAAPDQPSHLNRIWALMLAMRRLCGECPSLRTIVTLRSSVWSRLTSESLGQRDQTDHMRGLVISLVADDKSMTSIIRKRLQSAADDAGEKNIDPYKVFFKGDHVTLPTSTETRGWDSFLSKSARERPRDAIQLIKNMIDSAYANKNFLIGSKEADEGMKVYSAERVDDIVNEYSLDCKNIRELINSFHSVSFESDFESLRSHLTNIPSISSTVIRGFTIKPGDPTDWVIILALLHEAGFINPRLPDVTKPKGYRHILFQEDPFFVKVSNWNIMQGATWEIHPAFRSYLIGVSQSQRNRKAVI